jgi:hypothetical protein
MIAFPTIAIPHDDIEKKLLDGFLSGRGRFQQEVEKPAEQGKLFL